MASDEYDSTGQLTSVAYSGTGTLPPGESYSYDANGNPAGEDISLNTSSAYGNNQVVSDGNYSYEYDANGNITERTDLTSGQVMNFTWDFRNRLTKVVITNTDSSTTTINYWYDMYNRLVGRTSSGASGTGDVNKPMEQWMVYDPGALDEMVLCGTQVDGVAIEYQNRYLWNPNIVDSLLEEDLYVGSSGDFWAITDRLGSVHEMEMYYSSGSTEAHVVTDAYGNVLSESSPGWDFEFNGGIGFAGTYRDPLTGMQNNLNRWYDPAAERWLSQDPANADIDTYRYCGNDPTNEVDPSGCNPLAILIEMGNAVGAEIALSALDAGTVKIDTQLSPGYVGRLDADATVTFKPQEIAEFEGADMHVTSLAGADRNGVAQVTNGTERTTANEMIQVRGESNVMQYTNNNNNIVTPQIGRLRDEYLVDISVNGESVDTENKYQAHKIGTLTYTGECHVEYAFGEDKKDGGLKSQMQSRLEK